MYDEVKGLPTNAQDIRVVTGREAIIASLPWKEWLRGSVAKNMSNKAAHTAAIQVVLHSLHLRGRVDEAPIDVSIDLTTRRKVVKASEDLPVGTLALPPCVPKSSGVFDQSNHPHRVRIIVTEKCAVADGKPEARLCTKGKVEPKRSVYFVHPEFKPPEESKEQLDESVPPHARAWEFQGVETMHPYWAVERMTDAERKKLSKAPFNMGCEDKEFAAVSVGALGTDSIATTFAVTVPIMTNTVEVKQGEELYLEATARKETKRKEGSWKTDVAKARAGAKTAASSLEVVTAI